MWALPSYYEITNRAVYDPQPGGGAHAASIILEDGTSYILLEDGTSSILLES